MEALRDLVDPEHRIPDSYFLELSAMLRDGRQFPPNTVVVEAQRAQSINVLKNHHANKSSGSVSIAGDTVHEKPSSSIMEITTSWFLSQNMHVIVVKNVSDLAV